MATLYLHCPDCALDIELRGVDVDNATSGRINVTWNCPGCLQPLFVGEHECGVKEHAEQGSGGAGAGGGEPPASEHVMFAPPECNCAECVAYRRALGSRPSVITAKGKTK
jgi:hypothetical protein